MKWKAEGAGTQIAAAIVILVGLTVSYAFLAGSGPVSSSSNSGSQGLIGAGSSREAAGTQVLTTSTATTVLQDTTTLTLTSTTSNSYTTETIVSVTTSTYTTTTEQTSTYCSKGQCISLVATSSTKVARNGRVTFRAVNSDPEESNDALTAFMDCGCNGGVAHSYFANGVGTFSVQFTVSGTQKVWVADGDEATNSSTTVYSNTILVTVS